MLSSFAFVGAGSLDELLFRALNLAGADRVLDAAMILITTLGAEYILVFVAVPFWLRGRREATFDLLAILAITLVLTTALKYGIDRARPCDVLPNVHTIPGYECSTERDPAFPSGHASRAFAFAAFVAIRYRWRWSVPGAAFAILVGVSRIYLGLHWPTDVLGGALLGIGVALLVDLVSRRSGRYQRIRTAVVEAIPHFPRRRAGAS